MNLINTCIPHETLLFATMPCTGGSPWGNTHAKKPGGAARLRKHWKTFRKIWDTFATCAKQHAANGGLTAMEWPKGCRYWEWDMVKKLLSELKLETVCFDGCMLGLKQC